MSDSTESGMGSEPVHAPVAAKRPVTRTFHGDEFVDDYEWMRDKSSPEVQDYVAGQNRYCEARMAHLAGLRERLFGELKSHVEETDMSVPTRMDGYWYFTRTQEGRQYAVQCRIPIRGKDDWDPPQVDPKGAPGSIDGEQVVFDANKEAEGHDFFRLGGMDLSKDGRWMLYGVDTAGDERYEYRIRDLATGEELPDVFPGIGGACFTPDARYVFWTEVDESWRPCAIWRHKVGEPAGKVDDGGSDVCVFREDDERFWVGCGLSFDERNIVIVTGSKTTTEVWLLPVATPEGEFSVFIPREPGIEYDVSFACFEGAGEHGEDIPLAVVQHNAKNPNFEIDVIDMRRHKPPYRLGEGVRVAVGSPYGCEKGDDFEPGAKAMPVGAAYFHPGNPDVLQGAHGLSVEGIAIHRHFVALSYRAGGLPRLAMMTKEQAAADFLAGRPWAFRELTPPVLEDDWDIDYKADEAEEQVALAGDDAAGPHARPGAVVDDVDDQLGDDDDYVVGAGTGMADGVGVDAGAAANVGVAGGLASAGVAGGVRDGLASAGVRDGLSADGRPVDDIHAAGAGQSAGDGQTGAGHSASVSQTDAQSAPVMVTETDGASDDPLPGETRRLYSIGAGGNPSYDAPRMRYSFSSYTRPGELHEVDPTTGHDVLLKRATVLGDFDPRDYMERRVWVTARDGEQIPVSLVWRRDIPMFHAPMFITGYGAYEISSDPGFSVARLSLLDRGVLYAVPHVRGGGEMGRAWYEQGRRLNKRHTFEDFVDATRALQRSGLASRRRTVANGGSAGGLLMGAVANMAPESYAGIEADVPFVDALTSILNPDLPLTVTEWDEWGDPLHDEAVYRYMKTYTPYENVPAVAGAGAVARGSDGARAGVGAQVGAGSGAVSRAGTNGSDGANGGVTGESTGEASGETTGATGEASAGAGAAFAGAEAKSDGVQADGRSASGGPRTRRVASFPRIFITTSMNDTRVLYVEPLKWLARLQAAGVDAVAKIEVEAGHGGISGRYKQWQEVSYENAWCLDVMGLSR